MISASKENPALWAGAKWGGDVTRITLRYLALDGIIAASLPRRKLFAASPARL
jgi:hypothetical protein